jgi:hypothetical protein
VINPNSDSDQLNDALDCVSETMRLLQEQAEEQEEIEMEQHYRQALWQANQAAQASWLYGALLDSGFEFRGRVVFFAGVYV